MPFCCKCGEKINSGDRFCVNCGNPQHQPPKEPVVQERHYHNYNNRQSTNFFGTTVKVLLVAFTAFIFLFVYSNFFVSKPDDVVEKFFSSMNRLDINTAVSCIDPTIEQAYTAAGNITGGLLGVNVVDVMAIAPFIPHLSGITGQDFQQPNFQVTIKHTEINGQQTGGLYDSILHVIDSFVNILGNEAIVYAEVYDPQVNIREDIAFYMKKFNNHGWRIMDAYPVKTYY